MRTPEEIQHRLNEYIEALEQAKKLLVSATIDDPNELGYWVYKVRTYSVRVDTLTWILSEDK